MQAHGIIVVNEAADDASDILEGKRDFGAESVFFQNAAASSNG